MSGTGGAHDAVVLLDAAGAVVGQMDKLAAHQRSTRHLAFSVVLFDDDGAVLLQRRAAVKYHFAGLWSNSCCSHPRPGEPLEAAGRRRVGEELGMACGPLVVHGGFWYEAHDPVSGLTEHEYDVVLVGRMDAEPAPDPAEASAVELRAPDAVLADYAADRQPYTPWLPQVLALATAPPAPHALVLG
ncbi:isopentenyl-diphosphate Delta-isomerase [soil metagenome]